MTARTPRGGNGRFTRSIETAQRDFAAAELRVKGRSLQCIADELGFASKGHAHDAITRAFAALPSADAEAAKRLDLERIDRLIEAAWDVMEREHIAYSNGQVVRHHTGENEKDEDGLDRLDDKGRTIPLYEDVRDDGPVLQAIDRIRALLDRRAKIFGYDAPARSRIEIITEDDVDAAIRQLNEEIAELDREHQGAT